LLDLTGIYAFTAHAVVKSGVCEIPGANFTDPMEDPFDPQREASSQPILEEVLHAVR